MVLPAQPATEVAPSTLPERIARLIAPFDLAPRPLSVAEALERSAALLQVAAVAWNAPLGGVPAPDVERALARLASVFVDGDPEPGPCSRPWSSSASARSPTTLAGWRGSTSAAVALDFT